MQPISICIQGAFWDSQIYSGELVLFDANGSLHRIDWAAVIDQLASANPATQTAVRVAFSDSDLFYTQKVRKILRDPQIESIIKKQLHDLAALSVTADKDVWVDFWNTSDAPFKFLPTDTDVYYNYLFAAGDEGLFSAPRSSGASSKRKGKHYDGKILQIKASNKNTAIAAAGGSEGLFEFEFQSKDEQILSTGFRLAQIPCSACDWSMQSIMAWNNESAFLASFRETKDPTSKRKHRTFDRVFRQEQIFEGQDTSAVGHKRVWGSHEKIFCISSAGLEVLDYAPASESRKGEAKSEARFAAKGKLDLEFDADSIVATGTAPFGTVLEFDEKLVVLRSDGVVETFEGEAVHWRVFPRSENYSNQLHIIYDDYIKIISFMHDYFVEQTTKLTGFARGSNDFLARSEDPL